MRRKSIADAYQVEFTERWELKAGKYRVFYDINEAEKIVRVVAVGHKEHNVLYIEGEEFSL